MPQIHISEEEAQFILMLATRYEQGGCYVNYNEFPVPEGADESIALNMGLRFKNIGILEPYTTSNMTISDRVLDYAHQLRNPTSEDHRKDISMESIPSNVTTSNVSGNVQVGSHTDKGFLARVYNVFIASPIDVTDERQIIRDVLDQWNSLHSQKEQKVLLPVGWETHSYSSAGSSPQRTLNKQILFNADLLIGVFWARLGTPTDLYPSGSVEEFEEHVKQGKPAMLYFSTKPLPQDHDVEQFQRLKDFKKSCQPRSLYKEYADSQGFRNLLLTEITHLLNNDPYFSTNVIQEPASVNKKQQLSEAAKAMLLLSNETGDEIIYIKTMGGVTIGPNGHVEDLDWDNKREIAKQLGALEELEKAGYIQAKSPKREIFDITNVGYDWIDSNGQGNNE